VGKSLTDRPQPVYQTPHSPSQLAQIWNTSVTVSSISVRTSSRTIITKCQLVMIRLSTQFQFCFTVGEPKGFSAYTVVTP